MTVESVTPSRAVPQQPPSAQSGFDRRFPELDLSSCPGLVVVAAHPDDELLGVGGSIAALVDLGVDVRVVSVCDRDASVAPTGQPALDRQFPAQRFDQQVGTGILGVTELIHLGLPSGDLDRHEDSLTESLTDVLAGQRRGSWCAFPWAGDHDRDSVVVARAAVRAAARTAARPLQYPVWLRHWAGAGDPALPWHRVHTVSLPDAALERKQTATQWYIGSFRSDARPALASVLFPMHAIGEMAFL